jgi:O-antigen/teichoic acid export membrane protein
LKHPLAALGATGATNAAITGCVLLNGVLMARLLGPAGRGAVFAIVAFSTAASALIGSFAHPVLARRAAAGEPTRELNGLCVMVMAPLAVAAALATVALVLWTGAPLSAEERRAGAVYAMLWTPASLVVLGFQAADIGTARWRRYNALRLLPYPIILAGLLACFASGLRTAAAALAVLLVSTLAPLLARVTIAWREGGFAASSPRELRALYQAGLPFLAAGGGAAALANADQVVAAMVLGHAEAGLYAVARSAGLVLAPLAMAAGVVGFSEAARGAAAADGGAWAGRARVFLVACAAALAPAIWALVPVLYGGEFAPARGPALLALGAGVVAALAEMREQRLEGAGRPLRAVPGRLAGAAAMTLAAVPGGLRWGPLGVVAATALGQGVRALVLRRAARAGEAA